MISIGFEQTTVDATQRANGTEEGMGKGEQQPGE